MNENKYFAGYDLTDVLQTTLVEHKNEVILYETSGLYRFGIQVRNHIIPALDISKTPVFSNEEHTQEEWNLILTGLSIHPNFPEGWNLVLPSSEELNSIITLMYAMKEKSPAIFKKWKAEFSSTLKKSNIMTNSRVNYHDATSPCDVYNTRGEVFDFSIPARIETGSFKELLEKIEQRKMHLDKGHPTLLESLLGNTIHRRIDEIYKDLVCAGPMLAGHTGRKEHLSPVTFGTNADGSHFILNAFHDMAQTGVAYGIKEHIYTDEEVEDFTEGEYTIREFSSFFDDVWDKFVN